MSIRESQRRAVAKYNLKNYDRVELRLPKGKKEIIKAHAEKQGESLNAFVNRAIDTTIDLDNHKEAYPPVDDNEERRI